MPSISEPLKAELVSPELEWRRFYDPEESAVYLETLARRDDSYLNAQDNRSLHYITRAGSEAWERIEVEIDDDSDWLAFSCGLKARETQILGNLPLVYTITPYAQRNPDLRQRLIEGLIQAVDAYSPEEGNFSTYVVSFMKGVYKLERPEGDVPLYTPRGMLLQLDYFRRDTLSITQRFGNLTTKEYDAILVKEFGWERPIIQKLRKTRIAPAYLDEELLYGKSSAFLQDPSSTSQYDHVEDEILVRQLLDELPTSQRRLLEDYFGLNGNIQATTQQIADRETRKRAVIAARLQSIYAQVRTNHPDLIVEDSLPKEEALIITRAEPQILSQAIHQHQDAYGYATPVDTDRDTLNAAKSKINDLYTSLEGEVVTHLREAGLDEVEIAILYLRARGLSQVKVGEALTLSQKLVSIYEAQATSAPTKRSSPYALAAA